MTSEERNLPPFPNGWFAVGFSRELPAGGVLARRLAGQDLVLFRTASGQPCMLDAYCPHLGAHLAHGGTVEGETIRCPFHGFRFDPGGTCVATGYGTNPPPTANTHPWPLREVNGLLMTYLNDRGDPLDWEIPTLDDREWGRWLTRTYTLQTHPQESSENGVDLGHLAWVHGYQGVEVLLPFAVDGPRLTVRYAMSRSAATLGKFGQRFRAEFTITLYGLGFSAVEVELPAYGMRTQHVVCATPVDVGRMEMRVAMRLHRSLEAGRLNPVLGLLPRALAHPLLARLTFDGFLHDLRQDFPMWEHKRYIQPPILAKGDGPIGKFRTWSRQFYSQPVPMLEREPIHMET